MKALLLDTLDFRIREEVEVENKLIDGAYLRVTSGTNTGLVPIGYLARIESREEVEQMFSMLREYRNEFELSKRDVFYKELPKHRVPVS